MLQPLNKEQKEAVEHMGSPLLVSAGPGSGKTRVIAERVKFLLKNSQRTMSRCFITVVLHLHSLKI